jgi:hypothetical protein
MSRAWPFAGGTAWTKPEIITARGRHGSVEARSSTTSAAAG